MFFSRFHQFSWSLPNISIRETMFEPYFENLNHNFSGAKRMFYDIFSISLISKCVSNKAQVKNNKTKFCLSQISYFVLRKFCLCLKSSGEGLNHRSRR